MYSRSFWGFMDCSIGKFSSSENTMFGNSPHSYKRSSSSALSSVTFLFALLSDRVLFGTCKAWLFHFSIFFACFAGEFQFFGYLTTPMTCNSFKPNLHFPYHFRPRPKRLAMLPVYCNDLWYDRQTFYSCWHTVCWAYTQCLLRLNSISNYFCFIKLRRKCFRWLVHKPMLS